MASENVPGSSNTGLAFVLGGVVVALAIVAWFALGGEMPGDKPDVSITVPGVGKVEADVKGSGG